MGLLTRGMSDDIKSLNAEPILGTPVGELFSTTQSRIAKHIDSPVRLYAAATANEYLYLGANTVEAGDGAGKITPPVDDLITAFVGGTIGFQAKSATATILIDGSTFAFPATTIGQYRRLAVTLLGDGTISARWSLPSASLGSLENPGALFSTLDGLPCGYVDLECTAADGKFKTAGSATNIIENKVSGNLRIFRFGAGGGGGGAGGDTSFKLKQILNGAVTLKKGKWTIDRGYTLISGNVTTDAPVDISLDFTNIIATPVTTTLYWLCIDRVALGDPVALTDTRQKVLKVYQASQFKLLALTLDQIQKDRYIPVGTVYTVAANWTGCIVKTGAPRLHSSLSSYFSYVEQYRSVAITTAVASTVLTHGLTGEPQSVMLYFWDNSTATKTALDLSSHLVNKGAASVTISSLGLTFDTSDYMEVICHYTPSMANGLAMASNRFVSPWYTDTATTNAPHGLTDMEDVAGYEVQEWDVTNGRRRNISRDSLVEYFDNTNFHLEWTGLVPSATLKYRVVTGGTALPAATPYPRTTAYTFTDGVSLTEVTTAYPVVVFNDDIRDLRILQKMATDRWQIVPLPDTIFVEKSSGVWYLRGDISSLLPTGTNPVKIVVASANEF